MSDAFDPNAPEGDKGGHGQYLTKRDLRIILIGVAVMLICLAATYPFLLEKTNSSLCTNNIKAISQALALYATEHDGRYPPLARTEGATDIIPSIGAKGGVYTWISDSSLYMSDRASFKCPSAKPDELVINEDPRTPNALLLSSYGLYEPYTAFVSSDIENPDQTIIVAETSNRGSQSSYDPLPVNALDKTPVPDGFEIGWSGSNVEWTKQTNSVTRLAFPGTDQGVFAAHGAGRHGDEIHALTAGGEEVRLKQPSAMFWEDKAHRFKNKLWTTPPIVRLSGG